MIQLEQFRQELLRSGSYMSRPVGASRTPASWLTTLRFSWNVMRVFPLCAIDEPCGKLDTLRWAHHCFSTVQCAERLGMAVEIDGFEHRLAHPGPVMYLCNHLSTTETILLPPVLLTFGPVNVVAKASLTRLPFLAKAAAHMGLVAIGRKSPREDLVNMMRVGTERIQAGNSFLIFPQGTRQRVFSRARFSSIGAKIAERAGCAICPLAIDTRCQQPRESGILKRVFHDFGPVDTSYDIRLKCGPIIPCGKAREMHEASFEWIASQLESWGMGVERGREGEGER